MCGRFAFFSAREAMPVMFALDEAMAIEPSYNIAPTDFAAVVRQRANGERVVSMLRWGLVPHWAKDVSIGNRLINARSETVGDKPAYRTAYRKRRCLVPADGFYEWRQSASGKQPHYIRAVDGAVLALAGLWERWDDRGRAEPVDTFTILTRAANDDIEGLHERMPVIVPPECFGDWLATTLDVADIAVTPARSLCAIPVSRRVNKPGNDGPELIEPDESAGDA